MTQQRKRITALAPGKLFLLGEYAVLEGAPAVVTAINRVARVRLTVDPDTNREFSVSSPSMNIPAQAFKMGKKGDLKFTGGASRVPSELDLFTVAFQELWRMFKEKDAPLPPCHIELDTAGFFTGDPPVKMGFGSSASLTAALIAALLAAGLPGDAGMPGPDTVYPLALSAHYSAQGQSGSGADIAAATWGGLIRYRIDVPLKLDQPGFSVQSLAFPDGLYFITPWTGQSASTVRLVSKVSRYRTHRPRLYRAAIEEMARLSAEAVRALQESDIPAFLHTIDGYYRSMEQLGEACGMALVSAEHRRLAEIARQQGAVYKPSGAGGGDCGIAFSHSEEVIRRTRAAMEEQGFQVPDIAAAHHGLRIEKETG